VTALPSFCCLSCLFHSQPRHATLLTHSPAPSSHVGAINCLDKRRSLPLSLFPPPTYDYTTHSAARPYIHLSYSYITYHRTYHSNSRETFRWLAAGWLAGGRTKLRIRVREPGPETDTVHSTADLTQLTRLIDQPTDRPVRLDTLATARRTTARAPPPPPPPPPPPLSNQYQRY
jgi:hypothetical protein